MQMLNFLSKSQYCRKWTDISKNPTTLTFLMHYFFQPESFPLLVQPPYLHHLGVIFEKHFILPKFSHFFGHKISTLRVYYKKIEKVRRPRASLESRPIYCSKNVYFHFYWLCIIKRGTFLRFGLYVIRRALAFSFYYHKFRHFLCAIYEYTRCVVLHNTSGINAKIYFPSFFYHIFVFG